MFSGRCNSQEEYSDRRIRNLQQYSWGGVVKQHNNPWMITAIPGMVHILRSSGLAVQAITGSDNTAKPQFAKAPGRYNSGFYCSRYYNAAGLEIPGNVTLRRIAWTFGTSLVKLVIELIKSLILPFETIPVLHHVRLKKICSTSCKTLLLIRKSASHLGRLSLKENLSLILWDYPFKNICHATCETIVLRKSSTWMCRLFMLRDTTWNKKTKM